MKLADRCAALLALVAQYQAERCEALRAPAEAQARALLRQALADGRRRVRTAIAEERARLKAAVGAQQAALHTERRALAQRDQARLLAQAWDELRALLAARWADADGRRRWVDAQLGRARTAFADGRDWQVRHHPAWTEAERAAAAGALRSQGIALDCRADAGLGAGLVVACGCNVLDASLDGLLADRALIEGRLLQLLDEEHP